MSLKERESVLFLLGKRNLSIKKSGFSALKFHPFRLYQE